MSLTTQIWSLKGKTEQVGQTFFFTGDLIEDTLCLDFLVNNTPKRIPIIKALKSLGPIFDEVRNGIIYYKTDLFEVDHNRPFFINPYWDNSKTTFCIFTPMPANSRSNSLLLCNAFKVSMNNIAQSDYVGVKTIGTNLAIRLSKTLLGISDDLTESQCIECFKAYFKEHPFSVIFQKETVEIKTLEDSIFEINSNDNTITCENNYYTSFQVEYPLEVIINTGLDVKEIQKIGKQVSEDKEAIILMKVSLEEMSKIINGQYEQIIAIEETITTIKEDVEAIKSDVLSQKEVIVGIEKNIIAIQTDMTAQFDLISEIKDEIDTIYGNILTIQSNINTLISNHNKDQAAHPFLKDAIDALKNPMEVLKDSVDEAIALTTENNEALQDHLTHEGAHPFFDNRLKELETDFVKQTTLLNGLLKNERIDPKLVPFVHPKVTSTNLYDAISELIEKIIPK